MSTNKNNGLKNLDSTFLESASAFFEDEKSKQAYYENIIACMPGNVYWIDKNCKTVGCNQNVLNMFGFKSPSEFKRLTFKEMKKIGKWSTEATRTFEEDTRSVIETGQAKLNIEEPPIPHCNRGLIYFLSSRTPLFDKKNNVVGVIGISIDVTQRKQENIQSKSENKFTTDTSNSSSAHPSNSILTSRQADCLYFLVKGMTAKHIAVKLNLSPRTIEHYLETLKDKFSCYSRHDLIEKAMRLDQIKNKFLK
jgi:DNA-binding CsgD family transcriptional regulator